MIKTMKLQRNSSRKGKKYVEIAPKTTQMVTKSAPRCVVAEGLAQDPPKVSTWEVLLEPFGATWLIWAAILAAKGVPKSDF